MLYISFNFRGKFWLKKLLGSKLDGLYNLCLAFIIYAQGFFQNIRHMFFMLSYYLCRMIARDIGGSDPERMSAEKTEQYVAKMFKDTCIKVNC